MTESVLPEPVNVAVNVELEANVQDAVPVPDTPEQLFVPLHPVNV